MVDRGRERRAGGGLAGARRAQRVARAGLSPGGLAAARFPTALGIFRQVEKPTYDDLLMAQVDDAIGQTGRGELPRLLNAGTTWLVD